AGLFVLPAALITTIPFCWVYACCQNLTVLGDREEAEGAFRLRGLFRRAWAEACRWPKQNHLVVWLLSPVLLVTAAALFLVMMPIARAVEPEWSTTLLYLYAFMFLVAVAPLSPLGVAIAANIGMAIVIAPQLLRMLLGAETVFSRGAAHMMNTTYFAIACGVAYLCMDPVVKAVYVLRCFYGESVATGEDLKVALRRSIADRAVRAGMWILAAAVLLAPSMAVAQEDTGTPGGAGAAEMGAPDASRPAGVAGADLDRAITEVIQQREYAWRMPRVAPGEREQGAIARFMESVLSTVGEWIRALGRMIESVIEWIQDLFPEQRLHRGWNWGDWATTPRAVISVLLIALCCVLAVWLMRIWRRRRRTVEVHAEIVAAAPDLEDEDTTADELPEDGWLALAQQLAADGQLRLALRALFLATLACLDSRELIRIAKFKSNRDYERELIRRAHAEPAVVAAFGQNMGLFESVWYGTHEITRSRLDAFVQNHERIRAGG
ncbi:MAG: hypothetical protein JXR94_04285, partial [Candidatus Hydrogenedentes bacterium]|nr:hypothetical protein [Candidatus Hydrogenedentota bacterium]